MQVSDLCTKRHRRAFAVTASIITIWMLVTAPTAFAQLHAGEKRLFSVETVADLRGPMPTGVTISANGRIFINFPQWGDRPEFAVGELIDGSVRRFPDTALNIPDAGAAADHLVSVQSVLADEANHLWILDTGAPKFVAPIPGGAKLIEIDLSDGSVVRNIPLGSSVALPTTYLNDVRVDLRVGREGTAYITDSSIKGPGAIIVVDIATGIARRRLSGDPSVMPEPSFRPTVDGELLEIRPKNSRPMPWLVAADGIALSPDGSTLYYCALSSRSLYSVPTSILRDPKATAVQIKSAVRDLGAKAPSDGLAVDEQGRIYAGDFEHGTIRRLEAGSWKTIASDPRINWPDTLSIGRDGYLYFTSNQLNRQALFHDGKDLRQLPYTVLRIPIEATPPMTR